MITLFIASIIASLLAGAGAGEGTSCAQFSNALTLFFICNVVLQDPVSQVQLLGKNATFVCSGIGEINNLYFVFNDDGSTHVVGSNEAKDDMLNSNGLFWKLTTDGEVKTWEVTILANEATNNTELYCRFKASAPVVFTEHAFLTVANGKQCCICTFILTPFKLQLTT